MLHLLRHLPEIVSDLAPDVRNPWWAAILATVGLIGAISWYGWSASSPARAAETAVRERLGDPQARFEKTVVRYRVPRAHSGARRRLVCGQVERGPYFAAVVHERRRASSALAMSGDRVVALAFKGQGDPALLAACRAERG
ncbi:hypothetical protein Q0812_09230 [Brevundimonas sp. 2R-24]|uniref:DUF3592 domain-containing protein n=1 Tax=Peiella sedimenti TaxID=3061083 RepID=A0ABT8SP50_9CAUL|nr:hypothetical protein [Caulobacteraceae bacterium XZ-24]